MLWAKGGLHVGSTLLCSTGQKGEFLRLCCCCCYLDRERRHVRVRVRAGAPAAYCYPPRCVLLSTMSMKSLAGGTTCIVLKL